MIWRALFLAICGGRLFIGEALAQSFLKDTDFGLEVAAESRFFFEDGQFEDQFQTVQGNFTFKGNARWTSPNKKTRIVIEPIGRVDTQDNGRTYFDLREASLSHSFGDWEVLVGVSQIFFGVAESRNVVDVINTFDTVEDFDQTEKLGQPLLRLSRFTDIGTFQFFYLPFFREPFQIGENGRLRFDPIIDEDLAEFERSGEAFAGDFAFRYSNTFGNFDVGVHGFFGTSRFPFLEPAETGEAFAPIFQEQVQGGVDVQYTKGPVLLKFEAAGVSVGGDTFLSTVGGFEYTFFDVQNSGLDVGLIGEFLFDSRDFGRAPITVFENDAFGGARIAFNDTQDTEILAGAIVDVETGGVFGTVEFQRRIGSNILLEVEGRAFRGGSDPFVGAFRDDSFLTLRLTRFF